MNDLRFAFRQLLKNPGFTAVVVITLALGIGANTAIFSVVNAVLLRPLPYPQPNRLVQIWQTNPRANSWGAWVSYPDFQDWRRLNRTFEEVGAFRPWRFNLTGGDRPETVRGAYVSSDLFSVLQVKPLFGRTFLLEEDQPGGDSVVLLSHGLWSRRLGADPGVVGKPVSIEGNAHTIVGVMPPNFRFPDSRTDIWIPHGPPSELKSRGSHNFRVVARLKPGVTLEQSQATMSAIARGLAEQYAENRDLGVHVSNLKDASVGEFRSGLYLLAGAVGLVLIIACANVANLLIARNSIRLQEVAVRQAWEQAALVWSVSFSPRVSCSRSSAVSQDWFWRMEVWDSL